MDKIELNSKIFMEKDDDKETDINYIKINELIVKKPKEMNLKYTILKNGIQTEKSMEEISESKIIIGNIEGEKKIEIEGDKKIEGEGEKKIEIEGEKKIEIEGDKKIEGEGEKKIEIEGEKKIEIEGEKDKE